MTRPLRRMRDVALPQVGDRERIDLLVVAPARRVDEGFPVFAERESRDTVARVGHTLRFTAVESHDEKLISPAAFSTATAAPATSGSACGRGTRRVAIRDERDEASVVRPLGARFVLVFRERELPSARQPAIERHHVDVRLSPGCVPVGHAQGVQHRAPIGTELGARGLTHVLRVEKGERPGRLCAEGRGQNGENSEDRARHFNSPVEQRLQHGASGGVAPRRAVDWRERCRTHDFSLSSSFTPIAMKRRTFLRHSATMAGVAAVGPSIDHFALPAEFASRPPMQPVAPISDAERLARIEKARKLMTENGIAAMFLEGGTSMAYFTGTRWGNSERPFGVVIPAKGDLAWVTPGFEEERARELIKFGKDIRVWQEDESPYKVIAGIIKDRGGATGKIAFEERVRF